MMYGKLTLYQDLNNTKLLPSMLMVLSAISYISSRKLIIHFPFLVVTQRIQKLSTYLSINNREI